MAIRQIEREAWRAFFDAFSRTRLQDRRTDYAEIRVLTDEDGAQPETAWLPLSGITYDDRDDALEVAVEHLDHRILHPSAIYVDELGEGIIGSMEVIRRDGTREIIEVR